MSIFGPPNAHLLCHCITSRWSLTDLDTDYLLQKACEGKVVKVTGPDVPILAGASSEADWNGKKKLRTHSDTDRPTSSKTTQSYQFHGLFIFLLAVSSAVICVLKLETFSLRMVSISIFLDRIDSRPVQYSEEEIVTNLGPHEIIYTGGFPLFPLRHLHLH